MARRKNIPYTIPYRVIAPLLLVLVSIGLLVMILKGFFTSYPYFNITKVTVKGIDQDAYAGFTRALYNKNIFSQNLAALKKQLEQEIPDVLCLFIERRLPGELLISLKKRTAIAQVKFLRFHPIDESGLLMQAASDIAFSNLPIILGIEYKAQKGAAGKYYSISEARNALGLIQEKNNSALLQGYSITKVKLAKEKVNSFFLIEQNNSLSTEVEVKFDPQKPYEAVHVLGLLLVKRKNALPVFLEGRSVLGNIEYIDLTNTHSPIVLEKKEKRK